MIEKAETYLAEEVAAAKDTAAEDTAAADTAVVVKFGSPSVDAFELVADELEDEEVLLPPQVDIFAAEPGTVGCPACRRLFPDESSLVLCGVPVGFELSSLFDPSSFVLVPSCLTSSSSRILAVLTPDLGWY